MDRWPGVCLPGGLGESSRFDGGNGPFYYRIQSPVVILELDHHCGVFLNNTEPKNFHIHTLVRTPNGNDYGRELLHQACTADASGSDKEMAAQA